MESATRRIWQRLQTRPQLAAAEPEPRSEPPALPAFDDRQGLFIIGAARSGTTVLQNALNSSPEIFLLGEPVLHEDPGHADFAARYNAMHRSWGNQENKSSFCPPLFAGDAPWQQYLERLAGLHRYAGSKIVVTPHEPERTCQALFEFHCRHFYRSHYLFTFRNPIDVVMSTRGLAELHGDNAASHTRVLRGILHVVALYIRCLRNLPAVGAVFHECIDATTFDAIGARLGLDLSSAQAYYDRARVRNYTLEDFPEAERAFAREVIEVHESLREQVTQGVRLVQLEQNSNHLSPTHFTALGGLYRRVEKLQAES